MASSPGTASNRIRRLRAAAIGAVVFVTGTAGAVRLVIDRAPGPTASVDARPLLEDGHRFVDSVRIAGVAADSPAAVSLEAAVALGYAERLRLGLGGPFRLADFALADPRLTPTAQRRTAWALLDALRHGRTHFVDPDAIAAVIPDRAGGATHHLALIERELSAAGPRAGELAVRLAYELAAAERLVSDDALPVLAQAAALLRDREVATRDVSRLLDAASVEGRNPLAMIREWRLSRRFASERPATELQDRAIERRALGRVPALLDSIRVLAAEGRRGDTTRAVPFRAGRLPLLPRMAADRLAMQAGYLPPQGPVVVAIRTHRAILAAGMPATRVAREWVESLPVRVVHDEALAAEHARTFWGGVNGGAVARTTLAAAVGMRAYAQEAPWFPGAPGPSADDLKRAFGFAEVKFASDVPAAWRPYFRRMIADAVTDMRRVVPSASFDGLKVRFETAPPDAPLAVHDPAARLLRLPVASTAGVLAHELAHDLDWQAAGRLYSRRTGYSTDYAVRMGRGRVAESVQGLTSARLVAPSEANGYRPPHDLRPAEVFARNFDWFVAVSLAREGRINGYLSAVQDEVLTGYATVSSSEADGRGAESLMRLLNDVAFVAAPVRNWFLEQWGPTRTLRSYALVRELMATPTPTRESLELAARSRTLPRLVLPAAGMASWMGGTRAAACDGSGVVSGERPQVALARLAADARARGEVAGAARRLPAGEQPGWAKSALGIAPWAPELADAATGFVRDGLLQALAERTRLDTPFTLGPDCAGP